MNRHRGGLSAVGGLALAIGFLLFFANSAFAERVYENQLTEANGTPLESPFGLAVDGSDNLWVSDAHPGGTVDKFSAGGAFEGQTSSPPWSGTYIEGVAFSTAANKLFVSDSNQDDVWGLNPNASYANVDIKESPGLAWGHGCCYLRVAADNSSGETGGDVYVSNRSDVFRMHNGGGADAFAFSAPYINGAKLTGPFASATALAVGPNGDLFVGSSNAVYQFKPDGEFTKIEITEANGEPLAEVAAIAVDPSSENILVADSGKEQIDEYEAGGTFVGSFTGAETPAGSFGSLKGLAVNSGGEVFVADASNHVVDVFSANAILPKVAYGAVTNQTQTSGTLNADINLDGGGNISSCSFEYGPTAAYGSSVPCSPATPYASNLSVSATIAGLTTETPYHYRVVLVNPNGTKKGQDEIYLPHAVAGLATAPATSIGRNCVTLNGSFNGNGEDTHYFFEWGTGSSYGQTTPLEDAGSTSGLQSKSFELCGLNVQTTYHFRIAALNAVGNSVGLDQTFETLAAVENLTTEPATNVRGSTALLHGSWSGDGTDTHYYFEWGPSTTYGQTTAAPPGLDAGSGVGEQFESFELTGLSSETTYQYRLVGSNSTGVTYGENQSFTTLTLPAVRVLPPTEYATTSVLLHADVNPESAGNTTYHFEYVTQALFETSPADGFANATSTPESASIGSDSSEHEASAELTGLSPGTTYHYRVVATNPAGSALGPDETLTTVPLLPVVNETSASGSSPSGVLLAAQINPGFGVTTYRFEYGLSEAYGSRTYPSELGGAADGTDHPASAELSGLTPGTVYHFRVVASNWAGVSHGADRTFETTGPPSVTEVGSAQIGPSMATLSGDIRPGFSPTIYRFEYGTTSAYGSSTLQSASIGSDGAIHAVSATLDGLAPLTTYHYRLVASNAVGTDASADQAFTTTTASEKQKRSQPKCKRGFVKRHGKCAKKAPHRKSQHRRSASHG